MSKEHQRCFIIAEIAQAHDGSLGIAHSYIDALAETGVDAVKFQTHIAEAESSAFEPFRVNFSYEDKTRYDYWKRMEFTPEQWAGLKEHCDKVGVEFMSSPFSIAAVELLEKLNVKRYKIGSGEVNNLLILKKIADTGKPIILSSGMSSFEELDTTITFLKSFGNELSVLQCNTEYPTPPERVGLNIIPVLKSRYNIKVGLSDHSSTIYPLLAAIPLGAQILEFHAVFSKKMFGPDAASSLEMHEIKQLVEGVRFIENALYTEFDKNNIERFTESKRMFGKSLAINKMLPEGHIIDFNDLESKKPAGKGISAADFESVIGRKLARAMNKYDFLSSEDIADE